MSDRDVDSNHDRKKENSTPNGEKEMKDHASGMKLALQQQETVEECYEGTSIPKNYRDFAAVLDALRDHTETKRFVWSVPRSLAKTATGRKTQESTRFESHKATCTEGDNCARCKGGKRPMFLDDYQQTFLGSTPCGGDHATVMATASCLFPNKCLGCMVRITTVDFDPSNPVPKKNNAQKKGKPPKARLHPLLTARADASKQRRDDNQAIKQVKAVASGAPPHCVWIEDLVRSVGPQMVVETHEAVIRSSQ
jgi:hypothetical protein